MEEIDLKNAGILIIDDQQANIDVLEGLLEFQGFENISSCNDSRKVMDLFERTNPDIVLLDLMMPYINGFEVMDLLKTKIQAGQFLPILVLTADITDETKKRALKGGATDFLTKPFDLVEVGLRIHNLLYTNHLQKLLLNQNQFLEEKVQERTKDLENANMELLAAKNKAEASDRLKTAFIQNISHEIRTPLNGIIGFSDLLVDPEISDNEKQDFIKLIQSSSTRLINTIEDYVNIAMIISGNIEVNFDSIEINSMLKESALMFEDLATSKSLEMVLLLPETELKIETDLELMRRIIAHLLDNAIKFTEKGKITIGYRVFSSYVELFISDTGRGISKDFKEKIFDIFTQEDNLITRGYEGSGLGLSIVKGLLSLLGGDIWLLSSKGIGSTFYLKIPFKQKK